MEQKSIDKVSAQIYRRFPPLKNQRPKVMKQTDTSYLLIYSGSGNAPDGEKIQQKVRVVATDDGQIIKISMSR